MHFVNVEPEAHRPRSHKARYLNSGLTINCQRDLGVGHLTLDLPLIPNGCFSVHHFTFHHFSGQADVCLLSIVMPSGMAKSSP